MTDKPQYNVLTPNQIAALPGASIFLKFEIVPEGIRIHSSFDAVQLEHMAIAIDHLQQQIQVMIAQAESSQLEFFQ